MKKTYCDICKKEIVGTAQKNQPIRFNVDLWEGTVHGAVHWGEKEIDVCTDCAVKLCSEALKEGQKDEPVQ